MTWQRPEPEWRYRVVWALALAAGVFTLVVAVMLVWNVIQVRAASPLAMVELDHLRTAYKANAADLALQSRIRDLDWAARQYYFSGLASRRTGLSLLFGGLALTLLSLRGLAVMGRRAVDLRGRERQETPSGTLRWGLAVWFFLLLALGLVVGVRNRSPVEASLATVPSPARNAGVEMRDSESNWPSFRGADGSGTALRADPPVFWDGLSGSNIVWKQSVPLPGMSSPLVWGRRVLLTGATEEQREVYCYDLENGTLLWRVDVKSPGGNAAKVPDVNKETGFAAATPVADEHGVFALFANGDLVAVDYCARVLWTRNLGVPVNRYGHSSSLLRWHDTLIVQYDQQAGPGVASCLMGIDTATGKTRWTTPRAVEDSWPSPVLIGSAGGGQVVTVANTLIAAYAPDTGRELWHVACAGSDVAPSPIGAGALVVAAVTGDKVYAIRTDGHGDVAATHTAWRSSEGVSDVPSPVSVHDLLFLANSSGLLTCLDLKSGAKVWEQGLDAEFYGSPGVAGDRLYLVARSGQVMVLHAGREYQSCGAASLGEPCDGSPVFVGNRILLRGLRTLFCIGRAER